MAEEKKESVSNGKFDDLMSKIESMSVLELSEFVKALEEKFGVSASAMMAAAPAVVAGGGEAVAGEEEKTSFDVVLSAAGNAKIQVIKVVKEATGLGLKEAKDLVDKAPTPVKEGVKKEEAEELKKKIEEAGGTIELK